MPNHVCVPSRIVPVLRQLLILLIALGVFAASAAAQTTVTLGTPGTHLTDDLYIQGGSYGSTDFSDSPVLASKVSGNDTYTRRIFLKFDTQNYVPANAVIQSAHLYLVMSDAESGENRPFTAYHVTRSFVKRETTWANFRNGQPWSRPGGDLGSSFGTTYIGNSVGSTYRFDLTQLVQQAVNGTLGSRYTRVALVDTGGASDGNYKAFHSTRASNSALRPRLVITYGGSTPPPPAPAPEPTPEPTPSPDPTPSSTGTTVTLSTPGTHLTDDLYIQGGSSGPTDFSGSPVLASKVSSNDSYTRRIFLKFDTQNYVPANAVIQSAYLYLVMSNAETAENRPFTAYHVTKSFAKGQTTWYNFRTGQPWSRPGGDFGPSYGTTSVGNAVGSTYRFDLTQLVQQSVNGALGSRYTRFALVDTGGPSSGNFKEFHSTRASNAALRPRLVITYGGSATQPAPTPTPPPSTSPAPAPTEPIVTTLRVMQWNVKKTKGSDGLCNPDRIANTIVAQRPDVVSLNEVNFYSGVCAWDFDMGERLRSLVQQKTGVTWYKQDVNVYGGTSGYGNVLLSRYAPTSQASTLLSYQRGVAQMGIVVNGRNINLFSTHVEYYTAWWRPIQINEALRWLNGFGEPRILMGDFNTWPGTTDYNLLATPYQDAWTAAQSLGTASAYNGTGVTHGSSRFDYIFHTRTSVLSLVSVTVPDTRVNGVFPSDHSPVIAVYRIN